MPSISHPISAQPIKGASRLDGRRQASSWCDLLTTLATKLYFMRVPVHLSDAYSRPIRVVSISDTHNQQPDLPDGDLLLHGGDLTQNGTFEELQAQLDWLNSQKHHCKVVIGGNHDLILDESFVDRFPERIIERPGRRRSDLRWGDLIYLQDESYTATFPNGRSLNIYGCPWTPQFGNWAFQFPPIRDVFARKVPQGTDILLTHGPPKYHLDTGQSKGCGHLLREIWRVHRSLKLVVFGHIHEGYGSELLPFDIIQETYEKMLLGKGGLFALALLGVLVLWMYVKRMVCVLQVQRDNNVQTLRLVNAAIASGPENKASRPPMIFQV